MPSSRRRRRGAGSGVPAALAARAVSGPLGVDGAPRGNGEPIRLARPCGRPRPYRIRNSRVRSAVRPVARSRTVTVIRKLPGPSPAVAMVIQSRHPRIRRFHGPPPAERGPP